MRLHILVQLGILQYQNSNNELEELLFAYFIMFLLSLSAYIGITSMCLSFDLRSLSTYLFHSALPGCKGQVASTSDPFACPHGDKQLVQLLNLVATRATQYFPSGWLIHPHNG